MLEGINGYCCSNREVRLHDCDGSGFGLLCLLCMANYYQYNRPRNQRYEEYYNKANGPITPVRPRYDKITGEAENSY